MALALHRKALALKGAAVAACAAARALICPPSCLPDGRQRGCRARPETQLQSRARGREAHPPWRAV
eukprot:1147839-Pyramimonas_sp.AAC.1